MLWIKAFLLGMIVYIVAMIALVDVWSLSSQSGQYLSWVISFMSILGYMIYNSYSGSL